MIKMCTIHSFTRNIVLLFEVLDVHINELATRLKTAFHLSIQLPGSHSLYLFLHITFAT